MENGPLIFGLIFSAVLLFLFGCYGSTEGYREKRDLKKRLERIAGDAAQTNEPGTPLPETRFTRFLSWMGKSLTPKKEENISELRRLFLRAGYRGRKPPAVFFGLKALLALSLFAATLAARLFLWQKIPPANFLYLSIPFAILGFYLPNLWIKFRISSRKEKIQRGLPDALDLMVVCVEAGTGLDAAMNRTAEEMKKTNSVLAEELGLVNLEIRAGKQRQEALRNLARRTDVEDLSALTALLIQTERFGTSIAQALRVHADSMRTKRFQRAEELAQKMPVKLIFPLALFILPMFFLVILGPAIAMFLKYFA